LFSTSNARRIFVRELNSRFFESSLNSSHIVDEHVRYIIDTFCPSYGHNSDVGSFCQIVCRPAQKSARGADLAAGKLDTVW
jgi:hypothetical protein